MKFRPTQRWLAKIDPVANQNAIGFFYSDHFKWIIVAVNVGIVITIYIYNEILDYNSTPLATFSLTGNLPETKANFLELALTFNSLNAVGNTDRYAILVSGIGTNLKYISKNNSGIITISDYKINTAGGSNINTPTIRKAELFENRLTFITENPQQIWHSADSVVMSGNAYEDFVFLTANLGRSFQTQIPLLGGEVLYDITNERRQLILLSNKGLSIIKTFEANEQFNVDNASFYRIETFPTFAGKTTIFANYAVYPTLMGLRVRAYSQIGTLYSPSIEPGCIPLPTVCPEMLNISSIKNIDISQSMAVVDSGKCYFMSYPRKISEDPYMSPAGSIYPRTTYFESKDFTVLDVANNIEALLLKRNSDGTILVTVPDYSKGFLSMFANNFVPSVYVTASTALAPGVKITLSSVNTDLIKFYMMINSQWYLFTKIENNVFATNYATPTITTNKSYNIFPAFSYDVGALLPNLTEFGNNDWSYSCLFENKPLHIEGYSNSKSIFSIPNPENIVSSITNCVIHRVIVPGEVVFESDTPPSLPSATSQVLLVFKEKTKDFLSFIPTPQQDQNASSVRTEKVMSMLKFPVAFSSMTNTTSIYIRPVLNNADTTNLTLVRFMYI